MNILLMRKQQGFVLAVSMIFLVIMTVLAITAIRRTTLDEAVAGNLRAQNVAFQAAEKALRYCESVLNLNVGLNPITFKPYKYQCQPKTEAGDEVLSGTRASILVYGSDKTPAFPPKPANPADPFANFPILSENLANWTGSTPIATRLTAPDTVANVAAQPQCMIEKWDLPIPSGVDSNKVHHAYVVTARAVGTTDTAVVWLQETIRCGSD